MTGRELRQEIQRMKNTLAQTKAKNKEMELEQSNKRKEHQMALYQECLKGLLCDNTVSAGELQFLKGYQQKREISSEQHAQVLENLGYTTEQFEELKNFEETTDNNECCVCFEIGRNWMILPCKHCCLCEECAKEDYDPNVNKDSTCPQCRTKVKSVVEVKF